MKELKLTSYKIENSISICEAEIFTLSIENGQFLYNVIEELKYQIEDGKDGEFFLLVDDKAMPLSKNADIINDFTEINFNSKKVSNLILKKLENYFNSGEINDNLINMNNEIIDIAEKFKIVSGLNVNIEPNIDNKNFVKLTNMEIIDEKENLLERFLEYIDLLCELKSIKLIILAFGKHFFHKEEIDEINKYCFDKNIRLMFLEGKDNTKLLQNEKRLIIDRDFCEIPQNFDKNC